MPARPQIGRACAYCAIGLTAALLVCVTLDVLVRHRSDALRGFMDAPLALTSWAYALLTPIASALALWLGASNTWLTLTVKVLAALWLVSLGLLFFLPFLTSPTHS